MRIRRPVTLIIGLFSGSLLFSQQQTQTFQGITNSTQTLQIDKYNGSSLESVDIQISISAQKGYLGLDNDAAFAQDIQAAAGVHVSIQSGQVTLFNADNQPLFSNLRSVYFETVSLAGDNGDGSAAIDLTSPDGKIIQPENIQAQITERISDSLLGMFAGAGSITLNINFNNFFQTNDSQEITQAGSPFEFEGELTVIYH